MPYYTLLSQAPKGMPLESHPVKANSAKEAAVKIFERGLAPPVNANHLMIQDSSGYVYTIAGICIKCGTPIMATESYTKPGGSHQKHLVCEKCGG